MNIKNNINLNIPYDKYKEFYKKLPTPTYIWRKIENDLILIDYNNAADAIVNNQMKQFLGIKARIFNIQNKLDATEELIDEADNILSSLGKNAVPPTWQGDYLICKFQFKLKRLEKHLSLKDKPNIDKFTDEASNSGKLAVRASRKYIASERTESYKLMGRYYWLLEKQKRALKWWDLSIKEGLRLGAKLELSRSYFEVGKRLFEDSSKYRELNGIKPKEYLEKARAMFEEMDLQHDLEQLERFSARL